MKWWKRAWVFLMTAGATRALLEDWTFGAVVAILVVLGMTAFWLHEQAMEAENGLDRDFS